MGFKESVHVIIGADESKIQGTGWQFQQEVNVLDLKKQSGGRIPSSSRT